MIADEVSKKTDFENLFLTMHIFYMTSIDIEYMT